MTVHMVLIDGQWKASDSTGTFQAEDPKSKTRIADEYPVSCWDECSEALDASVRAFNKMRQMPADRIAAFLDRYADLIENRADEICEMASRETALPVEPRLISGELPRTTGQLRQAAQAVRRSSWCQPTIDTGTNIRSCFGSIGPVAVFGPNNFPLAFGSISGSDFAAAIAAGNPVIAKANSLHPGTTRLLAEQAIVAAQETGMPDSMVQLIYRMSHADGERLARDPRLASIGYTGSRDAGLKLKAAADSVGKQIYLELSSINPVVVLPNSLKDRGPEIADELTTSCLMGTGQFCTNPGLIILQSGADAEQFTSILSEKFAAAATGTLLSRSGQDGLCQAISTLNQAGAEIVCGGVAGGGQGYSVKNTIMQISGEDFIANSAALQTEAFGNATLLVKVESPQQALQVIRNLEGNLTGCIYSAADGSDDEDYDLIAPDLRQRVGRLLNDKMPTGVAVCPAMNHGGPFPATGHAGFTAVGMPDAIVRFAMLQCFDNVRDHRLPSILRDENPGNIWRRIDGQWTTSKVAADLATV